MERARFPMQYLRVTQKAGVGSHLGSDAVDFGGKDTGVDALYAPYTGKVVRVRNDSSHETYFESLEPVEFANGTIDYMTCTFMHDEYVDVKTGQIIKQGEKIADEGGFGRGSHGKFANHSHIETSRGKDIAYQVKNAQGTYCTPNQVNVCDAFWLGPDVVVLYDGGYTWKRDDGNTINQGGDDDMKFLEVFGTKNCQCFTKADVNAVDTSYNGGTLTSGETYPIVLDTGNDGTYQWLKIYAGGATRYAAVISDRCKIVTLSAGDAVQACIRQGGASVDTEQIEALTKRAETAEATASAYLKAINAAKAELEV